MTKTELTNLKNFVITVLERDPLSRDSDDRLYVEVCKAKNQNISSKSFEEIMLHRNDFNLPAYSSVGRARRKAQAERTDLVGTVRDKRRNLESEYIDFALN